MNKKEKIKYYEIYFKNLSPSTFEVNIENDKIIIDGINNPYPESFDDTKIEQYSYMKKQKGGNIESEENVLQEALRIQQTGTMKEKANFLAENPQLFAGKFFAKGGTLKNAINEIEKLQKNNYCDSNYGDCISGANDVTDILDKYKINYTWVQGYVETNKVYPKNFFGKGSLKHNEIKKHTWIELDNGKIIDISISQFDSSGGIKKYSPKDFQNAEIRYTPLQVKKNKISDKKLKLYETKMQFKKGGKVSNKIRLLKNEGYPQNQAVAIALSMRDENKLKKGGKVAKTWKQKYNKKYGFDLNESHSLKDISKKTGVSKKGLQAIYNKGVGAWKNNLSSVRVKGSFKKNPNTKKFPRSKRLGKEQWAMARVYSAVMGGKASKVDSKELKMKLGGNILLLFFIACMSLNLISCKNWEVVQEIDVNCYHLYNVKTKKVNVLLTKEKLVVGKLYNLKSIEKVDLEDPTIE